MPRESKYKKDHTLLRQSGMFWEFHPELSGEWEKDKEAFIAYRKRCEKIARITEKLVNNRNENNRIKAKNKHYDIRKN